MLLVGGIVGGMCVVTQMSLGESPVVTLADNPMSRAQAAVRPTFMQRIDNATGNPESCRARRTQTCSQTRAARSRILLCSTRSSTGNAPPDLRPR